MIKLNQKYFTREPFQINPLCTAGFLIWFGPMTMAWSIVYIEGSQNNCISFCEDRFYLSK